MALFSLLFVLATVSLATPVHAGPQKFEVPFYDDGYCPYPVTINVTSDTSFDITYDTRASTPNSLAAFGPGVDPVYRKNKCYINTLINFYPSDVLIAVPSIEESGTVRLDNGLKAKIETAVNWYSHDYLVRTTIILRNPCRIQVLTFLKQNFTTVELSGPLNASEKFSERVTNTTLIQNPSCSGDPGTQRLIIVSTFEILANEGAPASSAGELGKEGLFTQRVTFTYGDGCQRSIRCTMDRYGTPFCLW